MSHSTSNKTLIGAAAAAYILCGAAQAQDAYEYADIQPPGTDGAQVFSVNERGDAVGNAFITDGAGNVLDSVAFTYALRKNTFELIDEQPDYDATSIIGNNNRGSLVGSVRDDANNRVSGVLVEKNGSVTVFDHPEAPTLTQARAINSRGVITGYRDSTTDIGSGFIYDAKRDRFTDIVPSFFTIAQGINARGDVVGSAIFFDEDDPCNPGAAPGSFRRYGWIRDAGGSVKFFTVNGGSTSARGISDSAATITGFTASAVTGMTDGFVIDAPGANCVDITLASDDIVAFPGAEATFPQAITNDGVVVGSYFDNTGVPRSFLATRK